MCVSGKDNPKQARVAEVAERTLRALKRTVPAALPGVQVAGHEGQAVLLELVDGLDPRTVGDQVLEAAQQAGRLVRFTPVEPTLAELFREAVTA